MSHFFQDRGIDATIFQNRHKLHLTVGTLALMNDREITQAKDVLKECEQDLVRYGIHYNTVGSIIFDGHLISDFLFPFPSEDQARPSEPTAYCLLLCCCCCSLYK